MAYTITYGGRYLFTANTEDVIYDTSLTQETNASAYFDFTIACTHSLYNAIEERAELVHIDYDGKTLFEGYVESVTENVDGEKEVSCVSVMSYLNDTVVRPYSTLEDGADLIAPNTVDGYFEWLIEQHNEHCLSDGHRFAIGVNEGYNLDPNNYIYRASSELPTTADEITDKILDSMGGYITLTYESEFKGGETLGYTLNLYDTMAGVNDQLIDFGENITDFERTIDTADMYTAIRPLSSTEDDDGNEIDVDITSEDDGYVTDDFYKLDDVVYSVSAVEKYGYREYPYTDSEAETSAGLLNSSISELANLINPSITLEVKAVDMALYTDGYEHLQVGELVRVRAEPWDTDEYLMVSSVDMDLFDPGNTTYTLGATYSTLTGTQSAKVAALNASIDAQAEKVANLDAAVKETAETAQTALNNSGDNAYVHIRYSAYPDGMLDIGTWAEALEAYPTWADAAEQTWDAIGASMSATPPDVDIVYIGIYSDSTETDSWNATDYTWNQLTGESGTDGADGAQVITATCKTAADSATKSFTLDTSVDELTDGTTIKVTFENANTYAGELRFDVMYNTIVNEDGTFTSLSESKTVSVQQGTGYSSISSSNQLLWAAGAEITFVHKTEWVAQNAGTLYGTSTTEPTVAEKVVNSTGAMLMMGTTLSITFTNSNTATTPTLNIESLGAQDVYVNGQTGIGPYWVTGQTVNFVFNGAAWNEASSAVYATTSTVGNAAMAHIAIDENSISIAEDETTTLAIKSYSVDDTNAGVIQADALYLATTKYPGDSGYSGTTSVCIDGVNDEITAKTDVINLTPTTAGNGVLYTASDSVSGNDIGFQCSFGDDRSLRFQIGSGGTNAGIYDDQLAAWIIYGTGSRTFLRGAPGSGANGGVTVYPTSTIDTSNTGVAFTVTNGSTASPTYNTAACLFTCKTDSTSGFIASYPTYTRTYSSSANMVITGNGVFGRYSSSASRYKNSINYLTNVDNASDEGLAKRDESVTDYKADMLSLLNLPIVKFHYEDGYMTGEADYDYSQWVTGFIAEDVERVCPECATYVEQDDEEKIEAWDVMKIVPRMLYIIQQQEKRITALEEKLAEVLNESN